MDLMTRKRCPLGQPVLADNYPPLAYNRKLKKYGHHLSNRTEDARSVPPLRGHPPPPKKINKFIPCRLFRRMSQSGGISRRKIVMSQSQVALNLVAHEPESDVWNDTDTLFAVRNLISR